MMDAFAKLCSPYEANGAARTGILKLRSRFQMEAGRSHAFPSCYRSLMALLSYFSA
jgi:hypothetical protein